MIQLTQEEQRRLTGGDIHLLKTVLKRELEKVKEDLLHYRPNKSDYDCVLKGQGLILQDLLAIFKER